MTRTLMLHVGLRISLDPSLWICPILLIATVKVSRFCVGSLAQFLLRISAFPVAD